MTGKERRRINPNKGLVKILERNLDMIVSRFLYPHLSRVWTPYSWLLERRFVLTETSVSPAGWPRQLDPVRVLLISDIHTGIFLKPQTLAGLILPLMELKPDLVTIAGDIVTGHSSEVRPFLDALAPLSRAPLGAWYAYGNHDYFGGDPEELRKDLRSVGITTLKNESVALAHGQGRCVCFDSDRVVGSMRINRRISRRDSVIFWMVRDFTPGACGNRRTWKQHRIHRARLSLGSSTNPGSKQIARKALGAWIYERSRSLPSKSLSTVGLKTQADTDPRRQRKHL
jgi:hypothetical protein